MPTDVNSVFEHVEQQAKARFLRWLEGEKGDGKGITVATGKTSSGYMPKKTARRASNTGGGND